MNREVAPLPKTRIVKASEARQQWSELLNSVFKGQTRVIVEKSGIPVAAIISAADLARLSRLDEERFERLKVLASSWETFRDIPLEEVEDEVAKAVQTARAQTPVE